MKKVLIVNTVNTGYNGITSVMMNYVRRTCHKIQYDFVLCGQVEEEIAEELKKLGNDLFMPECSRVKSSPVYFVWLKKVLKSKQYDAIHVHGNSGTMYLEIAAAKQAGIPVRIAHSHNTTCKFKFVHRMLKPLLNRTLTNAIACSEQAGKWLFDRNYTVLQNGIDIADFSFSQTTRDEYRKLMHLEGKYVIGHIGRMDVEKNQMYLLRVFEKYIEQDENAHLLLIGDGSMRQEIEQYIKEHDLLARVHVLGRRADAAQLYQCMDVLVLPSLWEGLPVTLIEAQTAGLPCIASDCVTKDANITGNIRYVGIRDTDIENWIQELKNAKAGTGQRGGWSEPIFNSKFNIMNSIDELLLIYHS